MSNSRSGLDGAREDFIGRVRSEGGLPAGTCFHVGSDILVTTAAVLGTAHKTRPGAAVTVVPGGGSAIAAEVLALDDHLNLAALRVRKEGAFRGTINWFVASESVPPG